MHTDTHTMLCFHHLDAHLTNAACGACSLVHGVRTLENVPMVEMRASKALEGVDIVLELGRASCGYSRRAWVMSSEDLMARAQRRHRRKVLCTFSERAARAQR